ncbi:DUF418 domain-containing protein [Halorubrum sp. DTA98]|uniref:DUF418 domain-containing protein n=1 Tax=Halorubrum sp. DTA98 TaxID=3402163 RepID=UPI003AB0BF79
MSSRSAPAPTPPAERIVSLDVLRGVAVLGILLINMWVFAMPETTLLNPTVYGDFTGANYWAWLVGHVFFQEKFITLFSVLFGAGIVLFTDSDKRSEAAAIRLHVRRMFWLIAIGMGHAYLLWYGDILVAYGVCALWVVALREYAPATQFVIGVVLVAVPSALELLTALSSSPDVVADTWRPAAAVIDAEVNAYRGGWLDQLEHRVPAARSRQTTGFVGATVWRVGGSMLLGMALFKWGVLSGERSRGFYGRLVAAGAVAGLVPIVTGVLYIEANDWEAGAALFWRQFNYWGSLPLAGSYIGLVALWCRWRPAGVVTDALAAVGRTAFTNYLLQTIVATSIFYGHGLGLFGHLNRVELLGVVVAVWAVQVPLSVLWLRVFRFGPVEWLWRTLTYGERQPLRT